jgi:hypothetical protein
MHPYTNRLQTLLDERGRYQVHNVSHIGRETEEMLLQVEELMDAEDRDYKIVIIQGGTVLSIEIVLEILSQHCSRLLKDRVSNTISLFAIVVMTLC